MTHAYSKLYLLCAQKSLGRMLDFSHYEMEFSTNNFWQLFLSSGVSEGFGSGDAKLIAGMSGIELAYEVLDCSGIKYSRINQPKCADNKSPEYWAGWALAYYQWYSALTFTEINSFISIDAIIDKYHPFHEMDISQFIDAMEQHRHQ